MKGNRPNLDAFIHACGQMCQASQFLNSVLQFAIYPLELVRTRLAVCPMGTYRGISDCFRQIIRDEGWRAFYRGLSPALVRFLLALCILPWPQ